jgi:hypothetical protein
VRRALGGSTIQHRFASLASLFEYLCERNAVTHNPVKGVERPKTESGEGKTRRSAITKQDSAACRTWVDSLPSWIRFGWRAWAANPP